MFFQDVGLVLWLSVPLVGANMLPVIVGRGGQPIDGRRLWFDGRRIFGDGKTWQGLVYGIAFAVLLTHLLSWATFRPGSRALSDIWIDGPLDGWLPMLTLAAGALLGDLVKSFAKRRGGWERGHPWRFWDQFDAVAGGFVLTWVVCPTWFMTNFIPGRWLAVLFLLIVYFIVHQALSRWAHRNGWKTSPC